MDDGSELERLRTLVTNLEQAVDSRDVIGQAKGLLMSRGQCSTDVAWNLLLAQSQLQNIKVVEIARAIVDEHHRRLCR